MPHTQHNSSSLAYTPPLHEENTEIQPSPAVAEDADNLNYGTEELLDALPKVWSRSLLYVFVGIIAVGIPWSMVSTVDETGSARGRIEPLGTIRKLDSV
ncbi:MAG: HlyD family secretion protein, partial [Nostocales cyanobacterium 94392]|nr:HlyD family secretion protein [Nostocales cyanobacterium 94392]